MDKKRTVVDDNISFWVRIKAKVNPDQLEEMIKRIKDKSFEDEYKQLQVAYQKSQEEINKLKKSRTNGSNNLAIIAKNQITSEDDPWRRPQAWNEEGLRYLEAEDNDRAMHAFTETLASNPNASQKRLAEEAIEHIVKRTSYAREHQPFDEAMAYFYAKDCAKAVEAFTKVIDLSKDIEEKNSAKLYRHTCYFNSGSEYLEKKQYDLAVHEFTSGIAFDPRSTLCYRGRARVYYDQDKFQEALSDYNQAIAMAPNDSSLLSSRGVLYQAMGKKTKAMSDFQKACDLGDVEACDDVAKRKKNK